MSILIKHFHEGSMASIELCIDGSIEISRIKNINGISSALEYEIIRIPYDEARMLKRMVLAEECMRDSKL
jgi:hypothetical protein